MRIFTDENTIAIYRQEYSGTPLTSSYLLSSTANGYLRPLSEEASATNGFQYGYGFNLITEVEVDIKEGDVVVIGTDNYTVRGVVNHNRGGLTQYKRVLMLRSGNTIIDTNFNLLQENLSALLLESGGQILLE